jgi:hypothetical protein
MHRRRGWPGTDMGLAEQVNLAPPVERMDDDRWRQPGRSIQSEREQLGPCVQLTPDSYGGLTPSVLAMVTSPGTADPVPRAQAVPAVCGWPRRR